MSYLILDAADDAVLAECESAEDVRPTLEYIHKQQPGCELIVVWFGDRHVGQFGGQSLISARTSTDAEGSALYRR